MIVERKDGSLWMLVRTQYGIGQSVSVDKGATWSQGGPSGSGGPLRNRAWRSEPGTYSKAR